MLLFAAALSAAVTTPAEPRRQAKASVRIVRAEPHRFSEIERDDPGRLRSITLRTPDGSVEQVRVVEYM